MEWDPTLLKGIGSLSMPFSLSNPLKRGFRSILGPSEGLHFFFYNALPFFFVFLVVMVMVGVVMVFLIAVVVVIIQLVVVVVMVEWFLWWLWWISWLL